MQKKNLGTVDVILSLIALTIATSIFLKAFFDMDTNYDVGWYHLPFAARIWGIIPAESFTSGDKVEYRYLGFPLLAHFFQGMLWKLTGRIQAANLVGYFSLAIYIFFLRTYFQIPWYISTLALFTIPAVLTHAPTGFVDLPGNIGVSVLVMISYKFYQDCKLPTKGDLFLAFLGAAAAVNTKPQLQPLVFIIYWVTGIRLVWLYWKYTVSGKRRLWLTIPLGIIASIVIFASPIKNVALYGNPFYPTKIAVAGVVLNHEAVPQTYSEANRPQKWLRSVLEINTPEWSADQFNRDEDEKLLDRAGGFFGAYVIFNLLLLLILNLKEYLQKRRFLRGEINDSLLALIIILLASFFVANFPQSHELRYFMFWMIVLVSLNLNFIYNSQIKFKSIQATCLKLVYLLFFIIVCVKIKSFYLKPDFRDLETYLNRVTNEEWLIQISPDEKNCLISKYEDNPQNIVPIEHAFYYSSYFHPAKINYSIEVQDNPKNCGNLKVVPHQNS